MAHSNPVRVRKSDDYRLWFSQARVLNICCAALTGLACTLFASSALSQTLASNSRNVVIRMDGPDAPAAIAGAIGRLVQNQSARLEPVTLEDARSPFQAIVRQLRWPVEIDRPEFDNLLCQRNRNICCVSSSPQAMGENETCTKAVDATRKARPSSFVEQVWRYCDRHPTQCTYRWTVQRPGNRPKYGFQCSGNRSPNPWVLCVPKVEISAFWTVQAFSSSRYESLHSIAERAINCNLRNKWRSERLAVCRSRFSVDAFNRLNSGDYKRYKELFGALNAPVMGYSVSINVPDAVISDLARFTVATLNEQIAKKTGTAAAVLSAIDSVNATAEFLIPQGAVTSQGSVQSNDNSAKVDREDESLKTLAAMGFTAKTIAGAASMPSMIVLEDGAVPYHHVELLEINAVSSKAMVAALNAGVDCPKNAKDVYSTEGDARAAQFLELNHAAGILGVIGASRNHEAALGIFRAAGISPSRVWLFKPDATDFQGSVPIKTFHEKCDGRVNVPLIVNLSGLTVKPDAREALRRTLIGDHGESATRLFVVAAAGNVSEFPDDAGKELPPDCSIYPSCIAIHTEHMISVVGLNNSGTSTDPDSLSGLAFEVAAISEVNAISAVSHGEMVRGSGSSFAVPYVSSLSALISARFFNSLRDSKIPLLPIDLKKRILATVDFLPQLDNKVEFGRINFSRALSLEDDNIEMSSSEDGCDVSHTSIAHGVPATDGFLEISGYDAVQNIQESDRKIPIRNVLRISRICGGNKRNPPRFNVIVYVPVREGTPLKTPQIIRYRDATLKSYKLDETLQSGQIVSLSPKSLHEYTACMRPVWKADCLGLTTVIK